MAMDFVMQHQASNHRRQVEPFIYQRPGNHRYVVRVQFGLGENRTERTQTVDTIHAARQLRDAWVGHPSPAGQLSFDNPLEGVSVEMEDNPHLIAARDALQASLDELLPQRAELAAQLGAIDQQVDYVRSAMTALNGSGPTRPPRKTPSPLPPQVRVTGGSVADGRYFLARGDARRIYDAAHRHLSTEHGLKRSELFEILDPELAIPRMNPDHVSRALNRLIKDGKARREVPGGNTAHTVYYKI